MQYLLVISFLLHLVTLFIIIVLVQRINSFKPTTNSNEQEKMKQEIEDLLIAYTAEMKEENDKLISNIIQKRKTHEKAQHKTIHTYQNVKPNVKETAKIQHEPDSKITNKIDIIRTDNQEEQDFVLPINFEAEDIVEKSSTAQILSLSKQGYSAKEIAKKLDIGDGEVELLLKFHK